MDKGTKVYGCSDDLIEFEGDVSGEVGCCGTDDRENGVLVVFSDGTVLDLKYGKIGLSIWGITVIQTGTLFERKEECSDQDADISSDIVYFKPGLKWAYAGTRYEKVS